jgi:hypothetical protein
MILALITRLSPLARWAIAIAAGLALIGGLILWLGAREQADDKSNQAVGAAVQREADQAVTIQNVKDANDAREKIKQAGPAGDAVRYEQCMRSARTPASCARYAVPQ